MREQVCARKGNPTHLASPTFGRWCVLRWTPLKQGAGGLALPQRRPVALATFAMAEWEGGGQFCYLFAGNNSFRLAPAIDFSYSVVACGVGATNRRVITYPLPGKLACPCDSAETLYLLSPID